MVESRQGGFQLGRYLCGERLGSGPLGEIWRARLRGLAGFEKEVAVRELRPELAANVEFMRRFMRAASVQAALQSARIVCVHEVEVVGGRYVLAAELAHGLDLARLLERAAVRGERVPDECALLIALELSEALRYAHRRTDLLPNGVLHLGLGPRQVMVTPDGEVRVLDIGLRGPLYRLGLGGPELAQRNRFIAPEVSRARLVDARADVFSVGALLGELAGPAADGRIAGILRSTVRDDPGDRCPSMQTLRDALGPLLGGRVARVRRELAMLVRRLVVEPGDQAAADAATVPEAPPFESIADAPSSDVTERGWGRAVAVGTSSDQVPAIPERDDDSGEQLDIDIDVRAASDSGRARATPPTPPPPRGWVTRRELKAAAAAALAVAVIAAGYALVGGRAPNAAASLDRAPEPEHPIANHAQRPAGLTPPRRASARTGSPVAESTPLAETPARAFLEVRTAPPGAHVYVDGELRGTSPLDVEVDQGLHAVVLSAVGQRLWHRPVSVRSGDRRLDVALQPVAPATHAAGSAGLKVRCATRGELRIFVDGADTGLDCPNDERIAVAPGRHHVALYAPRAGELYAVQKEVKVSAGNRSTRVYLKY